MTRITSGNNGITQAYKKGIHNGVDIGWHNNEEDNKIIAHSEGTVVGVVKNISANYKTGNSYGNYIKIKHPNGYFTLYAHLKYGSVYVSVGQKVAKGQVIAVMGNTGHALGRHLHWELRNPSNVRIDPTNYINADLPNMFNWEKGNYKMLKTKYIRNTPEVINTKKTNKIKLDNITNLENKKKCFKDSNGYAKTIIGETFELTDFKKDNKGNIWGKLKYSWICVQDSTGNQVERV